MWPYKNFVDDSRFPYATYQGLGAAQIIIGLATLAFGIAETILSPYMWVTGFLAIWIPVFIIITGAIGLSTLPSRADMLGCLKNTFLALSIMLMLASVALAVVEGYIHYTWYQEGNWMALTDKNSMIESMYPRNQNYVYYFMIPIVVLASIEFVVATASIIIVACFSPLYEQDPYGALPPQPMPMMARPMVQAAYPSAMPAAYPYYAQAMYAQQQPASSQYYQYPTYQAPSTVQAGSTAGSVYGRAPQAQMAQQYQVMQYPTYQQAGSLQQIQYI
jgi:hypothetical protein